MTRALALAESADDAALFARAALAAASMREFMTSDARRVATLERALAKLAGARTELAARVMARLARDLVVVPGSLARRDALSAAAVDLARSLEAPRAIAIALDARLTALYSPDNVEERARSSDELLAIARDDGDLEREIAGLAWKLSALIERGEIARAQPLVAIHAELADELRLAGPRINAASRRASLAFLEGRFDDGLALAAKARDIGRASGDGGADVLYAAQVVVPGILQKREDLLVQSLPGLDEGAARMHTPAMLRALGAWARAAIGRTDEARAAIDALAADGFASVPLDFVRVGALCALAAATALVGDATHAKALAPLLSPYRDRNATAGTACSFGSVAYFEGLLARTIGEDGREELAFGAARNRAMGATPWAALCEAAIGAPAAIASPARARAAHIRRDGDHWVVGFDGDTVHVRQQRGLELVARLIDRPGIDVHAFDLMGGADEARQAGVPVLDERARRDLKARIDDLDDTIAEAESMNDPDRASRARHERAAIAARVAESFGLGGRARRSGDAAERARVAAAVAIRRGIAAVERHFPELAAHLARSIKTGLFCRYEPDPTSTLRVTT